MMSKAKSRAKLQIYNVIGLGPMRQLVKLAKRRQKGEKKEKQEKSAERARKPAKRHASLETIIYIK